MKRYRCVVCKQFISAERVHAALSRGKQPLYDSDRCRSTAAKRRQRADTAVSADAKDVSA